MVTSRAEGGGDAQEGHMQVPGVLSDILFPSLGGGFVGFPCINNLNLCVYVLYLHLYVRLYWLAVATIMVCNKPPQYSVAEDHDPLISQLWGSAGPVAVMILQSWGCSASGFRSAPWLGQFCSMCVHCRPRLRRQGKLHSLQCLRLK